MTAAKRRNTKIEALRILLMTLIVIRHFMGESGEAFYSLTEGGVTNALHFGMLPITALGVSTFAYISGYFGVKMNFRKFFEMEMMAVFYGGGTLLISWLCHELKLSDCAMLLPISSGSLWFFSAYLLLMLFAPFINYGISNIDQTQYRRLLIALICVNYFGKFLLANNGTNLLTLLIIYLLGRYMNKYPVKCVIDNSLVIFIVLLFVNWFITAVTAYFGIERILRVLGGNCNPLTLITSVCLFHMCYKIEKETKMINQISRLAPSMFAVYVCHESIRLSGVFDFSFLKGNILYVLLFSIIIVFVIALFEIGRVKLFKPVNTYIFNKLKQVLYNTI
mgnify:CR=1 FL=1